MSFSLACSSAVAAAETEPGFEPKHERHFQPYAAPESEWAAVLVSAPASVFVSESEPESEQEAAAESGPCSE